MPQRMSANGYAVLKNRESCKLIAYPDPKTGGDPWTNGWGSTGPDIKKGTVWTQPYADERLSQDVALREGYVIRYVNVPLTQGQFDACVDAVYNIGVGSKNNKSGIFILDTGNYSTFLKLLNNHNYSGARAELLKWVSPRSNVERGLRIRRVMEQALWDGKPGFEAIRLGLLA